MSAAVMYRVEGMTGIGGSFFAVSANGNAAGSNTNNGNGLRYQNGVLTNVGRNNSSFATYVLAVNDSGTLAGYQQGSGSAAVFYDGTWSQIATAIGGISGGFQDINNAGVMVGRGAGGALIFDGTNTVIDPNFVVGWSISDGGVIVGERQSVNGNVAVIRNAAGVVTDLPVAGRPHGISANGRYVVATEFNNVRTGLRYDTQTGTTIAVTGSFANVDVRGVNSSGVVTGQAYNANGSIFRAFVYDTINGLRFLNDLVDPALGLNLSNAYDINDAGQIVANGVNAQGQDIGYLLTPISDVPEPATCALTGLALASLTLFRRRNQPHDICLMPNS